MLVTAAVAPSGTTGRLVRAGLQRRFTFVICRRLVAELDTVLRRQAFRRYLTIAEVAQFVEAIEGVADVEADPTEIDAVSRDPDDDYLLALAAAAHVDCVVSGDGDLLDVEDPEVPVNTPRWLLDQLALP